jgi:hypothetical protein
MLGDEKVSTKTWTLLNSFTPDLPKKDFYVKVPLVDWGEVCPSCSLGDMDDDWGEEEMTCKNCGWEAPWVYTNLKWLFERRKKNSSKGSKKT